MGVFYVDCAIEQNILQSDGDVRVMWCARMLKLKHPELPVKLAARLKQRGYRFVVDMFGNGEESDNIKALRCGRNQ